MSLGSLTKDIFEAQEIISALTCSCCLNGVGWRWRWYLGGRALGRAPGLCVPQLLQLQNEDVPNTGSKTLPWGSKERAQVQARGHAGRP